MKMKMIIRLFGIILLCVFLNGVNNSCYCNNNESKVFEWELSKEQNNIKVFTRKVEGAEVKEFKAVTTVVAKMESLTSIIRDVNEYHEWMTNVESATVVKEINENEKYTYNITDIPWPISDRDIVMKSEKSISPEGVVVYKMTSSPDFVEEKEDYIRIREARGKWQFTPKENGQIEVTYQFFGDPAGSLPNWVINMFIVDGPYETLMNLKKKVEN